MVADDDYFVGDGAVDHANGVPEVGGHVILFVDEIDGKLRRRGASRVGDVLVAKSALVRWPNSGCILTMAIKSTKKRKSFSVGDWQRWNGGDLALGGLARNAGLRWVANRSWVTGSDTYGCQCCSLP